MMSDSEGWTALHWAAFHGQPRSATALLAVAHPRALLEVRSTDSDTATALELAEKEKNHKVAKIIRNSIEAEDAKEAKAEAH